MRSQGIFKADANLESQLQPIKAFYFQYLTNFSEKAFECHSNDDTVLCRGLKVEQSNVEAGFQIVIVHSHDMFLRMVTKACCDV